MSTRSLIGIQRKNKSIDYIYCHFDGYPTGVGAMLNKHYTNRSKLNKLMNLGDLSILGPKIGKKINFDLYNREDQCLAYGRDRGETGIEKKTVKSEMHFTGTSYLYLFKSNKWHVCDNSIFPPKFKELK